MHPNRNRMMRSNLLALALALASVPAAWADGQNGQLLTTPQAKKKKAAQQSALRPSASTTTAPAPVQQDTGTVPNVPGADDTTNSAERVNVESIKQKYWARGEESELGVVQNREYSKAHKVEVTVFGGVVSTDAFLSVQNLGASIGYHFTEYLSFHLLAWKDYVSQSSEFTAFQQSISALKGVPATPDTNYPQYYYGGEGSWSLLYGKLSVLGKAIIHYDLHLLGGLGLMNTESGGDITESLGIGQQVFLTKVVSVRVDYRLMHYEETLLNKIAGPPYSLGATRANWTNAITLGVSFLLGGSSDK